MRAPGLSTRSEVGAAHLAGRIVPVPELATAERERMYRLLTRYFTGVSRRQFDADLAEKEWVILLRDAGGGEVRGFSTLMRLRLAFDGRAVVAFFSGDTIIEHAFWGETELPRLWGRHVFGLAAAEAEAYWFLICSGYKTYRFLPVFFREFDPTWRRPTPPAARRLLEALARAKFGPAYDAERGVVRPAAATALRRGVAEVTPRRLRDPDVAFFATANPGHARGDELACLVRLDGDNLTRAGRRMLGLPGPGAHDAAGARAQPPGRSHPTP